MSIDPSGMTPSPDRKIPNIPSTPPTPSNPKASDDSKYDMYLNSPFAKMFTAHGAAPTGKEMQAVIYGIIKDVFAEMNREEKFRKKNAEKIKQQLKGD